MKLFACLLLTFILGFDAYTQTPVPMDGFFGVNVNRCEERPEDIDAVADWIRDYTRWAYFEPGNNDFHFSNAIIPRTGDTVNYDRYYLRLKEQGIQSLFVVMRSPKWASSRPEDDLFDQFAPSLDQNGLLPTHYKESAEFHYQLAARYGSKKLPEKALLTADKMTGMDVLGVIEVENEPDGPPDWGDQVTLEQYAAQLNAVYDGNQGKLGKGYGIKAADPDMTVSVGGLGFNLPALKEIIGYAGRQPFDIINVHFYTFKNIRENYRVSIPPEWSSLEFDMREIVEWRNVNATGKPVWLTEIGWDTKDYSTEIVTEQEAANYLIRSYLLALGAGVEKCFWFIFKDLDTGKNPHVFLSSGLFENEKSEWEGETRLKPKMTYWYNATFKALTAAYVFEGDFMVSTDSTIRQYNFTGKNPSKKLAVLWYCSVERKRWQPIPAPLEVEHVYEVPDGWEVSRIIKPADGTINGKEISTTVTSTGLKFLLSGTPAFILLEKTKKE